MGIFLLIVCFLIFLTFYNWNFSKHIFNKTFFKEEEINIIVNKIFPYNEDVAEANNYGSSLWKVITGIILVIMFLMSFFSDEISAELGNLLSNLGLILFVILTISYTTTNVRQRRKLTLFFTDNDGKLYKLLVTKEFIFSFLKADLAVSALAKLSGLDDKTSELAGSIAGTYNRWNEMEKLSYLLRDNEVLRELIDKAITGKFGVEVNEITKVISLIDNKNEFLIDCYYKQIPYSRVKKINFKLPKVYDNLDELIIELNKK